MQSARHRRRVTALVIAAMVVSGLVVGTSTAGATRSVRGFDGSTITVAGYGIKQQLPGAEFGARARIEQFNSANEIKGVKIKYLEFADDMQDPATALSEVRRLVSQDQVFALLPDMSLNTPGTYITQQHVPNFGGGFSPAYCSTKPDTSIWSFGFNGCQVTPKPTVAHDTESQALKYVQQKTGHKHPTVAFITEDNAVGRTAAKLFKTQFVNDGYKVVGSVENLPPPPVSDYAPYVQKLLTIDHGKPPDFIRCGAGTSCLPIYGQLRAGGFKGEYEHNLYTDALVKPFKDSFTSIPFTNLNTPGIPALEKLKAAVNTVKPGQAIDSGVVWGYLATDMFIQALKTAAKGGKSGITPEEVQKAAATQTWQIKGLAGPTKYPASTVAPTPTCRAVVVSDGTKWNTVEPYVCNTHVYPVK